VVVSDDLRIDIDIYLWKGLSWLELDDVIGG
jgi:hypothetical protein